jgi:DNA excision repair protein ERCC-1
MAAPPVVIPSGGGGNAIIVNPLQRGNPVLEAIRNVSKEFGDIVCDYQVGRTTGVLFLRYPSFHSQVLAHPFIVSSTIDYIQNTSTRVSRS